MDKLGLKLGFGTAGVLSVIMMFLSAMAIKFAGLTFIILLILEIFSVIDIGFGVIFYPILMFVGGIIFLVINWVVVLFSADKLGRM